MQHGDRYRHHHRPTGPSPSKTRGRNDIPVPVAETAQRRRAGNAVSSSLAGTHAERFRRGTHTDRRQRCGPQGVIDAQSTLLTTQTCQIASTRAGHSPNHKHPSPPECLGQTHRQSAPTRPERRNRVTPQLLRARRRHLSQPNLKATWPRTDRGMRPAGLAACAAERHSDNTSACRLKPERHSVGACDSPATATEPQATPPTLSAHPPIRAGGNGHKYEK